MAVRVLHVIPSLQIGGSERQLVELIRRSSNPGAHRVVVFDEPGRLANELPTPVIRAGPLGRMSAPVRLPLVASRIRRRISEERIDLVHAHHDLGAIVAAIATPPNIPLIAERQGTGSAWLRHRSLRRLLAIAFGRVDLLLCNARYLALDARRRGIAPPEVRVVYPGVDAERFASASLPPFDEPTVAVVANLLPVKRQDRFLRAFAIVVGRYPTARAILVGGGSMEPALRALAVELGIERSVEFAGQLADPRPAVTRSHVVGLTSDHEGFPNALLEAMSMGRPVVATDMGGVSELVRHGAEGWLVPRDPASLAAAIGDVFRDPRAAAAMGERAGRRARAFGLDRMVAEMEQAYQEGIEIHEDRRSSRAVRG